MQNTRTCTCVYTSHNCELGEVILCNGSPPFGFGLELQGKTITAGKHKDTTFLHTVHRGYNKPHPQGIYTTYGTFPSPKYDNCCWATARSEREALNPERAGAASGYICAACAGRVLVEAHCVGTQTSCSVVYTASGVPTLPPHTLQHSITQSTFGVQILTVSL